MKLYKEDGNSIYFDLNHANFIKDGDMGANGYVYQFGNDCIKFVPVSSICKCILRVKNISNKNLYKILDLYYKKDYTSSGFDFNFAAYSSIYYQSDNRDIYSVPTDYVTDNFRDLISLCYILADNGIEINDLHANNVILQNNNIVIIDADDFYLHDDLNKMKIDYIRNANITEIRFLLFDLLYCLTNDTTLCDYENSLVELFLNNKDYSLSDVLLDIDKSKSRNIYEYVKKKCK